MLVVIGIIVALAAVIVPMVIQFSWEFVQAAQVAEWDAVQTTIDTMMTDQEMAGVAASTTATVINDTDDFDPGLEMQTLASYTRDPVTNYCYE